MSGGGGMAIMLFDRKIEHGWEGGVCRVREMRRRLQLASGEGAEVATCISFFLRRS